MSNFETHLLDLPQGKKDKGPHGVRFFPSSNNRLFPVLTSCYQIPGREQYKHIIFGPDASGSGYDAAFFPAVRDALDARDWPGAQAQVQKAADILSRASDKLLH
jgi:hypothetical protein